MSQIKNSPLPAEDIRIKSIVIVGGGTAGWMAAATLANRLSESITRITLVESTQIGTIGVGEATVPYIKEFLLDLGINEVEFMRATNATYKLGIAFQGWKNASHSFMHPFAGYGSRIAKIPFHHYWHKMQKLGKAKSLDAYCLGSQIAVNNKFALPKPNTELEQASFNYAFHFDAGLFANFLSDYSQKADVKRLEANVTQVQQNTDTGFVQTLSLDNGETLEADLFIDCSGLKGLLIEETLQTGFEDWGQWLKCNRAVALPCETTQAPSAYTRSLACEAGWQWKIPLQNRIGNGHVYASDYISDEKALSQLEQQLEGVPLAETKVINFKTGMRKQVWNKNVFSLGLASGFMEPLESTSIYMIQSALNALVNHFPNNHFPPRLNNIVNNQLAERQYRLRDFLILHYSANQRIGEPFWDDCRTMVLPSSLQEKIEYYKEVGQPAVDELDFFGVNSWLAMFAGFGVESEYYHPRVDDFDTRIVEKELHNIALSIEKVVANLPSHAQFLANNITQVSN